ncbi:3-oxoacyl-[acyl-carrier-protein] synthase 2 [Elysia marginata]|uniref:beta-ketoacyl-[acyl-carrier-protein] synthase I n=1 Tax=Elysia marginata TaxID=1093978 RepID=A0AAV4JU11_9GAST|nr:3-oxoacyl-[acyl-carrier-protein] synthase 2 [Elysia marginata]
MTVWGLGVLVTLSTLTDTPVMAFLTTLGAASAIVLLIFKDTILGFVASIQVSANDIVRIDDWVTQEKYGADGEVIEINLTTVKVRNFDNTITTIPTYSLTSDSFKNWRGMQEGGGRRIKRCIFIKQGSVKFLSEGDLERLSNIQILEHYIRARQKEVEDHNLEFGYNNKTHRVNGRNLTNLGVFRKYCDIYLENHKAINGDLTLMTRHLQPTNRGIPIEIYAFCKNKEWVKYERVQADIFEHLIACVSYFDLAIYESFSELKKFACELKAYDPLEHFDRKEQRKYDRFAQYALVCATEAIEHSGLNLDRVAKDRVGVIWGTGIGGIETFQEEIRNFEKGNGIPRYSPFFIPKIIVDIAAGLISMKFGFRGPNFATVSACASSANAIVDAYNYIRLGYSDIIVTGGSEAAISKSGIAGFNALHALSTRNEDPSKASRPFDKTRDGFVLGEGAGAIVLEEYESAKLRGAKIYSEVVGAGLSADAYHMTAPHPEGVGVIEVMKKCLESASLDISQLDAINTHGTSTPLGDAAELKAIVQLFGSHAKNLNINSTKSMTGHLLGAAGAIESIACILSIENGEVPPTINYTVKDENISPDLNLTLNKSQKRDVCYVMSNTFGFGGHNVSILFKKTKE